MQRPIPFPIALLVFLGATTAARAEIDVTQAVLRSLYPAGGQVGTTVDVTFTGSNGGLEGATGLLIDGPPGVAVEAFESKNANEANATLKIAADAVPGRRMIRVEGGVSGLTNFRWFFVGSLAEHVESGENNEVAQAEEVAAPLVVNGRVERTLDQDCFRFQAREGQSLVLAVQSHRLDAMGYDRNTAGFADASLELLDEAGSVLAEEGDTLGYDPLIHYVVPRDGWYVARVSGMGYGGFPYFAYRLTIGDVPYPTALFPPGGKRGESVEVTFTGPNVPPGTTRTINVGDGVSPVQYVALDGSAPDLPFARSGLDEIAPDDPANEREKALPIDGRPLVVNGRFEEPGDVDWFRVDLAKDEGLWLDALGQRRIDSPVDTLLEVYDAKGEKVAANDDGEIIRSEVSHVFVPFDSQLPFRAPEAGSYFVRLAEQSGAGGPRAVYRLTVTGNEPDFDLYQWPDAVGVWGPGTTAAFVVELHRLGGLKQDVEVSIEGLPDGWTGSSNVFAADEYRHAIRPAFGHKQFLTITAPADAEVGTVVEFRVVGRAKVDDREIVHPAEPLNQLSWHGEPNRFRPGITSRAVVARPQGVPLESEITELTAKPGATVEVPLRIGESADAPGKPVTVSVNQGGTHFKCAVGAPMKVTFQDRKGTVKFPLPGGFKAGHSYDVLVSDVWTSETRKGLPGPCTRPIRIHVVGE